MAFGEKVRQYILRHVRELGIGCGIWLILMGVYILIIASNAGRGYILHPGTGYVLLGISFITMNLLEWKPLLMLTCTVVVLGLAMWILVFRSGDDTAERAAEKALESNGVPDNESKNKVLKPNLLDR